MSFSDTPYPGIQKFLRGQEFVIPLKVRQAKRGINQPRQQDDPLFDPNLGVTYSVYYGQNRVPLLMNYPMIRVALGIYQASYATGTSALPGAYDVEAVARHGPVVQRTWYRAAFWIVEE